ncbi:MAG: hypothetical protein AB7S56_08250 [Halothiobacillaceae bacterium]
MVMVFRDYVEAKVCWAQLAHAVRGFGFHPPWFRHAVMLNDGVKCPWMGISGSARHGCRVEPTPEGSVTAWLAPQGRNLGGVFFW